MRKALALLHGLPLIVYAVIAFVAYTKFTQWSAMHRARDEAFVASTVTAFREINDENARLLAQLAAAQATARRHLARADSAEAAERAILAAHPVATAPASCAPWVQALLTCQLARGELKHAATILATGVDSAAGHATKVGTTLTQGAKALKTGRCGFPCLEFAKGVGLMLDTQLKPRAGIFVGLGF